MLTNTFVHLQGIGYATEARLWQRGAMDWTHFLQRREELGLSRGKLQLWTSEIEESVARLQAVDHAYFAARLASRDQWRAWPQFAQRAAFLDIETTGASTFDAVTVIGLYDGREMRQFVRGRNLGDFPAAVSRCALLVTFFGTGFDLPVLRRTFPQVPFDQIHVDLCFLLKRLGYRGGLKRVEEQLGLRRSERTRGLSGWDAVRLWHEYRRGSWEALSLLLRYNEEDVLHMKPLLEFGYRELYARTWAACEGEGAEPSPGRRARSREPGSVPEMDTALRSAGTAEDG
jgi:uncharacterized protein YprB with RNaseH-like and TPR domain